MKASSCLPLGLPAVPRNLPGPSPAGKVLEARVGAGCGPGKPWPDCAARSPTIPYRETCLPQGCRITTKRRPDPVFTARDTEAPRGGRGGRSFQRQRARGLESGGHAWLGQAPLGQVSPEKGREPPGPEQKSRGDERSGEGADGVVPSGCSSVSAARRPRLGADSGLPGLRPGPPVPWSGVEQGEALVLRQSWEGRAGGSQGCPTPGPRPPGQRPGTWSPGRA